MFKLVHGAGAARSCISMRYLVVALIPVAILASTASCAGHSGKVDPAVPGTHPVETEGSVPRVVPIVTTTPATTNIFELSEIATAAQIKRSLAAGKSIQRQLEWVKREESVASGEVAAGEYIVTYLITPADDYYDMEAATDTLPAHHTTVTPGSAHVSVVVRDAADGRTVQGLDVHATLGPPSGAAITGTQTRARLPFGWHPILNRYGENMILPESPFTLTVRIGVPTYQREDSVNGSRFRKEVTARFTEVSVSADSLAGAAQRLAHGDRRDAVELSREEGKAIGSSIAAVLHERPANGLQRQSGDYSVAVLIGPAQGAWAPQDGGLTYFPTDNSISTVNNVEVSIRDAATGRALPDLNVRATIIDSRKKEIDTYVMPFVWSPRMDTYGLNVAVPGNGRYTIQVRAAVPAFRKYGSSAVRQFKRPVNVDFRGLRFFTRGK